MAKRAKRLQKIRRNPQNVSKEMLDSVLRDYGFEPRGGKGSHTVYQHPNDEAPIVVAAHGAHVPVYIVKQILDAIDRMIVEQGDVDGEND